MPHFLAQSESNCKNRSHKAGRCFSTYFLRIIFRKQVVDNPNRELLPNVVGLRGDFLRHTSRSTFYERLGEGKHHVDDVTVILPRSPLKIVAEKGSGAFVCGIFWRPSEHPGVYTSPITGADSWQGMDVRFEKAISLRGSAWCIRVVEEDVCRLFSWLASARVRSACLRSLFRR